MIKQLVRFTLNRARGARDRIAYSTRSADVPTLDLDEASNVLIITVDCLRNDRLSKTGYRRDTTPFLDGFGTHTAAIAPAPWTFSSVPSILSGLYPHRHGAAYSEDASRNHDLSNPPNGIRDDVFTLPELLDGNGYSSAFFTAIETAAIPIRGRFPTVGHHHDVDAETLSSHLLDWWNDQTGPRFGYIQFGDLHEPLHEPESNPFGSIPDVEGVDRWRFEDGDIDSDEFDAYRSAKILLYDTLVREVDTAIMHLLEELQEREDTIIVVTSDHGEEFWEYTEFERENFTDPRGVYGVGHGHALVPPVLEVPIISNISGLSKQNSYRSLTDLVPTILRSQSANIDLDFDGVPLQETRESPPLSEEIAYGNNQISVTDDDHHLIHVPETGEVVTIDFETGTELSDQALEDQLLEFLPASRRTGTAVSVSEDVESRLSELGYTE